MTDQNDPVQCLQEALLLSHRMMDLADRQQWEAMQRLDRERMRWLERAFSGSVPQAQREQARLLAEQIQALNMKAMHKAEQQLKRVKQTARDMQRNLKAARAYLENTEQGQLGG